MEQNPYGSPMPPKPGSAPMPSGTATAGQADPAVSVAMPLYQAKGWLKLIGIIQIIGGVLQCLTIFGAIVGWVPIWMGILYNRAASNLEVGVQRGSPQAIHEAMKSLATAFTIMGVLTVIGLVFAAMYICFIILMVVVGIGGAATQL